MEATHKMPFIAKRDLTRRKDNEKQSQGIPKWRRDKGVDYI